MILKTRANGVIYEVGSPATGAASGSDDADLTAIAELDSSTAGAIASDGAGWIKKTYAQFKTALSLVKGDVGLGNVDNTSDANKPVSTAQQTALDLKANLASPTFTGNPLVPTQAPLSNNTRAANTAYVEAAITAIIGTAPGVLDTLGEISDAINDDANLYTTLSAAIAAKVGDAIADGVTTVAPSQNAVFDALALKQASDADLTTIAALDSATAGALVTDGAGWIRKTYAQLKTALALVKGDVGLGNVDNTADTAKPISTATQTALDAKLTTPGAWSTYTPALTAVATNPTLGTSPVTYGHYLQVGKLVTLAVKIKFGTGGSVNAGSGIYKISLPVNALAAAVTDTVSLGVGQMFDNSAAISKACTVRLDSASTVRFTTEAAGDTTNAIPWTWATADFISFTIQYEAA